MGAFPQQKKGRGSREDQAGKRTKCLVLIDGLGIPLGSHTDSAPPAEITLLDKVLGEIRVPTRGPGRPRTRPKRVIGDKAYDIDPAQRRLRQRGICLWFLIERTIGTSTDKTTDSGIANGGDI